MNKILYPDISQELIDIEDKDQKDILIEDKIIHEKEITQNTNKLKDIIEKIGWPNITKVGVEASRIAWLVAQHSDYDLEFQKHCLKLMMKEPDTEIRKQNIAYLLDRVNKNEGSPQLYGTQFSLDGTIYDLEDPENVDTRRAEMGLSSIEEYIKQNRKYSKVQNKK